MKKAKDLLCIALIYILAFVLGFLCCFRLENTILRFFVFDIAATVVTFLFSLLLHNSSVYDAYWSLTPMVMSIWLFIGMKAFSVWQILFLGVFNLWSLRLTLNWVTVFTDFSYEDWRYRKYREENVPFMWFVINFFGIHMVPTLVVFAGMLPLFALAAQPLSAAVIPGLILMLCGIALEFFADRQMHAHLASGAVGTVCRRGLWQYSRHPNYLGEMTVWVGVFVSMLPFAPERWYYVIGAVCVIVLFNVVSVPLMEKRQLSRRAEYAAYRSTTSRLLLLPPKKTAGAK